MAPIVKNTFVDIESSQDLQDVRDVQSEPDWRRDDASDLASEVLSDVSSSVDQLLLLSGNQHP